jgi:hypothetical protein
VEPDAIIEVRFTTTEEGGRRSPVEGDYRCPFVIDGEAFDGRLLLSGQRLELGLRYEVPVRFLNPELVIPMLAAGKPFVLWEGKAVATGRIIRVLREGT